LCPHVPDLESYHLLHFMWHSCGHCLRHSNGYCHWHCLQHCPKKCHGHYHGKQFNHHVALEDSLLKIQGSSSRTLCLGEGLGIALGFAAAQRLGPTSPRLPTRFGIGCRSRQSTMHSGCSHLSCQSIIIEGSLMLWVCYVCPFFIACSLSHKLLISHSISC
jgi:hypothetical protein